VDVIDEKTELVPAEPVELVFAPAAPPAPTVTVSSDPADTEKLVAVLKPPAPPPPPMVLPPPAPPATTRYSTASGGSAPTAEPKPIILYPKPVIVNPYASFAALVVKNNLIPCNLQSPAISSLLSETSLPILK
jgi:hypothetical protein